MQTVLRPRERTSAQPLYLNSSAIELVETAIAAARKETLHLYSNAYDIIAGGLGLDTQEPRSERSLEEVTGNRIRHVAQDIDEQYASNIKRLYADIIAFISRARPVITPSQADDMFAIRSAGKHIVKAIKATKHTQKNLALYLNADNKKITDEYLRIRHELAPVLPRLELIRDQGDERERAEKQLALVHAQRKKGAKLLKELLAAPERPE